MQSHRLLGIVAGLLASLALAGSAQAAFPGKNGRIAFTELTPGSPGSTDIRSIASDGSDLQSITIPSDLESFQAAWSPAGTKVAFGRVPCNPEACDLSDVWVANAAGGGEVQLTTDPRTDDTPAWSPDGTKIVFSSGREAGPGLYVMNADGTNQTRLTQSAGDEAPAWSPDGSKIAFEGFDPDRPSPRYPEIRVVPAAGGTPQSLSHGSFADRDPDWSPDGSKIVFARQATLGRPDYDLYVMQADGTGQTPILQGLANGEPAWSPQGDKIVFQRTTCNPRTGCGLEDLYTINPDGSGLAPLFGVAGKAEIEPSWQPIPVNSYPRPRGANIIRAALVPAYRACDPGQANASHGPPLAHPSCAAPALTSSHLTLGTPDANGRPANSQGNVRAIARGETPIDPNNGDQADVTYGLQLTDVRNGSDLSDYTGELEVRISLRVTDRDNTPSPFPTGAATVADTEVSFIAPCVATASPDVGATCTASTTADALVPGAVKEGKRAVWELGKVRVFDGGADGDAQTGPNTLFAVQGVFVP